MSIFYQVFVLLLNTTSNFRNVFVIFSLVIWNLLSAKS